MTTTKTTTTTELVRLHVSPLTPDTYPIVIPSSLHQVVTDISYHQIPTFPERNYGYVELPADEAAKLQKRLQGAIVKGAKIKVQTARPKAGLDFSAEDITDTSRAAQEGDVAETREGRITRSTSGKPVEAKVVFGVQLPDNRRVKRGWTQPIIMKRDKKATKGEDVKKSASKAKRSEFTDKEECLFKTKNKTKGKEQAKEPGKKRKRGDDTVVVHEFEKTTKFPSFLRSSGTDGKRPTSGYDADKGWVDADGQVLEQPRRSKRLSQDMAGQIVGTVPSKSRTLPSPKTVSVTKATKKLSLRSSRAQASADDDTSSSGGSDSSEDERETSMNAKRISIQSAAADAPSSSASDDSDEENPRPSTSIEAMTPKKEVRIAPAVKVSDDVTEESRDEVHPLEAIFKKPKAGSKKPPGLALKIPFSFFGNDGDEGSSADDEEAADKPGNLPQMPQTPFTQADLRFRRERSAAPTPDTAAPTKLLFGPVLDRGPPTPDEAESSDGDDEAEPAEAADSGAASDKPKRSEFADKWFWENRGDNSRAWKKRRREVAKEKRHAANKRSAKRA